ncbi:DMT family transporter [Lichenibacterium ramalinae]|uniref:Guanidinium exporter n=1 Tax=Lichenibacterium ramalinae TaxID=2316527 RepID=A0A4Q2RIP9_9HYPH|nr:SMR family transporter [Lichenibacterium ramalinae]RYB07894.1 QacE family quaternary ammonium compound efflux SMR transporter [Lichenibacterium ramalinae]
MGPAGAWATLAVAGLLEVVWSYAMKRSDGFTRFWPAVVTVVAAAASFLLLAAALRSLPLGTAYAAWTGIGALGAFALGILVLGEPATALRIGSALLILAGIVGLKAASGE